MITRFVKWKKRLCPAFYEDMAIVGTAIITIAVFAMIANLI